MPSRTIAFFALALIAGAIGFGWLEGLSASIAQGIAIFLSAMGVVSLIFDRAGSPTTV